MSNQFGICRRDEEEIRARDTTCVYCHKLMNTYAESKGVRRDWATIEHLNFNGPFYVRDGLRKEDVVICCHSCNSSRGKKALQDWFQTKYCIDRNIGKDTVADPVRQYLRRKRLAGSEASLVLLGAATSAV
jgi:hypothetical protein